MRFVATTSSPYGEDVHNFMTAAVEHRFGYVRRLYSTIKWAIDNGSCNTPVESSSPVCDANLRLQTISIGSPHSNGIAHSFVSAFMREYLRVAKKRNAIAAHKTLASYFHHSYTGDWRRAHGNTAPREYINRSTSEQQFVTLEATTGTQAQSEPQDTNANKLYPQIPRHC